jgi:hypothetical protein
MVVATRMVLLADGTGYLTRPAAGARSGWADAVTAPSLVERGTRGRYGPSPFITMGASIERVNPARRTSGPPRTTRAKGRGRGARERERLKQPATARRGAGVGTDWLRPDDEFFTALWRETLARPGWKPPPPRVTLGVCAVPLGPPIPFPECP